METRCKLAVGADSVRRRSPFDRTAMFSSQVGLGNWVIMWFGKGRRVAWFWLSLGVREEDRDAKRSVKRTFMSIEHCWG